MNREVIKTFQDVCGTLGCNGSSFEHVTKRTNLIG